MQSMPKITVKTRKKSAIWTVSAEGPKMGKLVPNKFLTFSTSAETVQIVVFLHILGAIVAFWTLNGPPKVASFRKINCGLAEHSRGYPFFTFFSRIPAFLGEKDSAACSALKHVVCR